MEKSDLLRIKKSTRFFLICMLNRRLDELRKKLKDLPNDCSLCWIEDLVEEEDKILEALTELRD